MQDKLQSVVVEAIRKTDNLIYFVKSPIFPNRELLKRELLAIRKLMASANDQIRELDGEEAFWADKKALAEDFS